MSLTQSGVNRTSRCQGGLPYTVNIDLDVLKRRCCECFVVFHLIVVKPLFVQITGYESADWGD